MVRQVHDTNKWHISRAASSLTGAKRLKCSAANCRVTRLLVRAIHWTSIKRGQNARVLRSICIAQEHQLYFPVFTPQRLPCEPPPNGNDFKSFTYPKRALGRTPAPSEPSSQTDPEGCPGACLIPPIVPADYQPGQRGEPLCYKCGRISCWPEMRPMFYTIVSGKRGQTQPTLPSFCLQCSHRVKTPSGGTRAQPAAAAAAAPLQRQRWPQTLWRSL